jgi:Uma2 family endonuclease
MGDAMKHKLPRRLFDVDEYHRMAEVGILTADERVELIDGEIIEMSPIGPPHWRCVVYLTEVFVRRLEGRAIVAPQLSVRLHRRSEPQPDVALLRPPLAKYGAAIPAPGDVLLVVEVADTSHYRDRVVKLPRYAASGVIEIWIVDLPAGVVDVYREPAATGYGISRRVERGAEVAPAAFPDVVLAVDDILG